VWEASLEVERGMDSTVHVLQLNSSLADVDHIALDSSTVVVEVAQVMVDVTSYLEHALSEWKESDTQVQVYMWIDLGQEVLTGFDSLAAAVEISRMLKLRQWQLQPRTVHRLCVWLDSYCDYGADCNKLLMVSDVQAVHST